MKTRRDKRSGQYLVVGITEMKLVR